MSIIGLFLVLIVMGVVTWAVTTYIPMDNAIKNMIRIAAVLIALLYILVAFGVIRSLSGLKVPSLQ